MNLSPIRLDWIRTTDFIISDMSAFRPVVYECFDQSLYVNIQVSHFNHLPTSSYQHIDFFQIEN